jgi:hypothetical protein
MLSQLLKHHRYVRDMHDVLLSNSTPNEPYKRETNRNETTNKNKAADHVPILHGIPTPTKRDQWW